MEESSSINMPLNLPEFRVLEQRVYPKRNLITVWIESRRLWAECPRCGSKSNKDVKDDHWRKVKELRAMDHEVVLQLRQRRMYCSRCQKRFYESFESVDVKQRQTKRLQGYLLSLVRGRSLMEAARNSPVTYRVLRYFYLKLAQRKCEKVEPLPRRIGVDEFATKKGHNYATAITSLTRHHIWGVGQKRTQETLQCLLTTPGACAWRVKEAVIDMWEAFFLALKQTLKKSALIIIDRFHVERHLYESVDKCRKRLSKGVKNSPFKKARKLFLTPVAQLSDEQKLKRDELLKDYPQLALCVHLADRLHRWYSIPKSRDQADNQLNYWLRCLLDSDIPELVDFAQMVKRWRPYIVNYFVSRSTNGMSEGFNTKIKLIKRLGYGRLTFVHLAARILLECAPP